MMLKLVFSNLLRNKKRSSLTLLGVIIGVMTIISLVSISEGIAMKSSSLLEGFQGIFLYEKEAIDIPFSRLDINEISKLERVQGVGTVVPEIWVQPKNLGFSGELQRLANMIFVIGISPELTKGYHIAPYYEVSKGRKIKSTDKNSIVIGSLLADELNLQVGNHIKVGETKYNIVGIFKTDLRILNLMIVTTMDIARDLGEIDDKNQINLFQVIPSTPDGAVELKKRLTQRFEDNYNIMSMQEGGEMLDKFIEGLSIVLWAISGIAGVVGGIGVTNTMLMSVMERTKEFGVLKAIGWKNKDLIKMIFYESIILSIVGAIIGIILSYIGVQYFSNLFGLPLAVTSNLIMQAMFFALTLGIVGGIFPAYKTTKMSPIEAVRG